MRLFEEAPEAVTGRVGGAVVHTLEASVERESPRRRGHGFRIADGSSTVPTMCRSAQICRPPSASIHPTRLAPLAGSVELAGRFDMPVDIARTRSSGRLAPAGLAVAPSLHGSIGSRGQPVPDPVRGEPPCRGFVLR